MIDFKEMLDEKPKIKKTNPLDIFENLDRKSTKNELRRHQETILKMWHKKFLDQKDVIVKMHTGLGKTLAGLLMLQSSINEGKGPALYLCPNNYLVSQIVEEAKSFGIPVVEFPGPATPPPLAFKNSEAIMVATCSKLFNGMSVFGISGSGKEPLNVGTIVMDDAHKCLEIIKDSFSLKIPKTKNGIINQSYQKIWNLFESSLSRQAPGTCSDIKDNSNSYMMVPFWSWSENHSEVLKILQESKDLDEIKYVWDLIKNKLEYCSCIISGKTLEIFPRITPIDMVPSFVNAKRRIFLSATLTEDAFLVRDLDIDENSVKEPLVLKDVKYSGERMMLLPTLLNPNITREDIIKWVSNYAKNHGEFGIFTLVPSGYYAKEWEELGAKTTKASDLSKAIHQVKELIETKSAKYVTILKNEYDGVDLPDEMCRILCMDSMPAYVSLRDKYAQEVRANSDIILRQMTQKIEQGLGRAIRGEKDYCIIIIIGPKLTDFLSEKEKSRFLSDETKTQIEIAKKIADIVKKQKEHNFTGIENLIEQCLKRNEDWKLFYHKTMEKITINKSKESFLKISKLERQAEIFFQNREYKKAADIIQTIIDEKTEDSGWYLQLMATYLYPLDRSESMDRMIKANKTNSGLLKPEDGVKYSKLIETSNTREIAILEWVKKHESPNDLILHVNTILDSISFGISNEYFEDGIEKLGIMLGFQSHRPEKITGNGPDNLWHISGKYYWSINCKNEVNSERNFISKTEFGQLLTEIEWFSAEYEGCSEDSIFIHPSSKLSHEIRLGGTKAYAITPEKLGLLKQSVQNFFKSLADNWEKLSSENIKTKLSESHLDLVSLKSKYYESLSQE